jgi:hypothetical protein
MQNYLLKTLNDYYNEILQIEGKLILSQSFIQQKAKEILKENRLDKRIVSAITSYRNISFQKGVDNLFTPDFMYDITTENLQNEVDDIQSQMRCFAISQVYEVFESFFINILTEYLLHNNHNLSYLKRTTSEDIIPIRDNIRSSIKQDQGINNKGLFNLIRKLSNHFRTFEEKNIYDVNIVSWFDFFSLIRHTLVHSRQIIEPGLLDKLNAKNYMPYFKEHFQWKYFGNNVRVFIDASPAMNLIDWVNATAHFIFSSLSNEAGLPDKVPQYS